MIRTGIGGWTYPDWRGGMFYPKGLRQADEQAYATRAVGMIEINATFYKLQKPESFAAWREVAPPGFVYSLKGSRFITNRKVLATAGEALPKFLNQGVVELGDKLGPVVWQLAATKRFEADDLAQFLAMLPRKHEGVALRHAIEVGHESFACAEFVDLARKAGVAIVFSEADNRVSIADRTADFAYLRMQNMHSNCPTGYAPDELDRIARLCRAWAAGEASAELPYAGDRADSAGRSGDVFALLINGAKERAPAAAMALAERLGETK
ncbi:DUF72 domain-containing protein [Tsuneonella rigui]|uniref:DUF72 domain-containing protein n=1 Tax=Tsuneonella rigui TaxID=1708790 RepID=UPI000F7DCA6C|nr:DUF72 domain-containing protein [Tsuneonella rigui]